MRVNEHEEYDQNFWLRMNLSEFETAEQAVEGELHYGRGYQEGDPEHDALDRIITSLRKARAQGLEDAETVQIALHGFDLYVLSIALRVQEANHDSTEDFKRKTAWEMFRRIEDDGKGSNLAYIDPPEQ